jgi:hypothetical protein
MNYFVLGTQIHTYMTNGFMWKNLVLESGQAEAENV